ncbi:MAG: hypothetical protein ACI857_001581 [Arenicella sp.]|jgi:hypothetical protein
MKVYLVIAVIGLIGLASCEKAELKKPVDVNFSFKMIQDQGDQGLQVQFGEINLTKFDVVGDRVEGDDISFMRSFQEGLNSDLNGSAEIKELAYDLPQGDYQKLDIQMGASSINGQPSLILEGKYKNGPDSRDFSFEVSEELLFDIEGMDEAASQFILLDKDMPKKVNIEFNVDDWFALVDDTMWTNADLISQNGEDLVLISTTDNIPIYQLVVGRIIQDNKAIFKN